MASTSSKQAASAPKATVFGHPAGLFTLFFAEMWERFSYYGMRALLIFYMVKGFLGYNDSRAYGIYGAYTALVYMTPYFGGMLADRVIGARRAVILGGLLMAAGHLLMTIETKIAFFGALALLIVGNGFFKPNISTIVGGLYPRGSGKKDGGFTIFYMGINLGAAMSPIICGYVGETFGWHYGFGLATIGMLIGVAVFAAPTRLTQVLILIGAIGTSVGMLFLWDSLLQLAVRIFLAIALSAAGIVAFVALNRGGIPDEAGRPRDPKLARQATLWVYLGSFAAVGAFALVFFEVSIALYILVGTGVIALSYILYEAFKSSKVERERLFVVVILMFFSMLFWAFFEQAGSSVNNFTDRNVDRSFEDSAISAAEVGQTQEFRIAPATNDAELSKLPLLSQEQLGYANGNPDMRRQIAAAVQIVETEKAKKKDETIDQSKLDDLKDKVLASERFTMTGLTALRDVAGREIEGEKLDRIRWKIIDDNVGMKLTSSEIPASEFQAANPIYILLFGLVFSALWTFLGTRNLEPSTSVKFALGLVQLGLGFGALWYGAKHADARGMVGLSYLLIGYLLHTTGELCLSPVGLSMVTKLSPPRIVSTVMGAWFLAVAFSNFLAGMIAALTGVGHGDDGAFTFIPAPSETVSVYGGVFGHIAVAAMASGVVLFVLSPLLRKWMHPEASEEASDRDRQPTESEMGAFTVERKDEEAL